jgi:hypothetical protein
MQGCGSEVPRDGLDPVITENLHLRHQLADGLAG